MSVGELPGEDTLKKWILGHPMPTFTMIVDGQCFVMVKSQYSRLPYFIFLSEDV